MTGPPLSPTVAGSSETTVPVPPRYWWLKRGSLAVIAAVMALLAVRLAWGHSARGRLAAEVAAARACGEPVTVDDFTDPTPTPGDDGNAADLIGRATAQLTSTQSEQQWDGGWFPDAPLTTVDRAMLRAIVAENAGPLALARRAADRPAANWGVRIGHPISAAAFSPNLNVRRELANVLLKSFTLSHDGGDDATALADVRAIVRESDAMATDRPFVITHLVAIGIEAIGTDAVERTAGTLRVDGGARPAAEALLRQLCDESADRAGGRRQWFGERLFQVEAANDPAAAIGVGSPWTSALTWPVRPMLVMDAAEGFRQKTRWADAMDLQTWPAARARLAATPVGRLSGLASLASAWSQFISPAFFRPVEIHFRALADRRLAAVLLAVRLYEADHGGHLPADLPALVPAYLPAVPVDPMSPEGHALRYVAAPGREAVYSVGTNGVDDGGSTVSTRPKTAGNRIGRWDRKDVVCPLVPPPPASQPGD